MRSKNDNNVKDIHVITCQRSSLVRLFLFCVLSALFSVSSLSFARPAVVALAPSAPSLETHAQNVYGHYTRIPPVLVGLLIPEDCQGRNLCQTYSGSDPDATATVHYNAYAYSKRNPFGRLEASYVVDDTDALVAGSRLTYRTDGQLATKRTFAQSGDGFACERTTYAYDALGRLREENRSSCGETPLPDLGKTLLAYDASNNSLLESGGSGQLKATTYTGRNRIERICSGATCQYRHYDPRGNLADDGEQRFRYTDTSQLMSRTVDGASKRYAYLTNAQLWESKTMREPGIYLFRSGATLIDRARDDAGHAELSHDFWFNDALTARALTGMPQGFAGFSHGVSDPTRSALTETSASGEWSGLRIYDYAGKLLSHLSQKDEFSAWPQGYAGGYQDLLPADESSHALTFFGIRQKEGERYLEANPNQAPLNGYVSAEADWPNAVEHNGYSTQSAFSDGADLPNCDELNPDCQMPALPDTGGSNGGGGGGGSFSITRGIASGFFGAGIIAQLGVFGIAHNNYKRAAGWYFTSLGLNLVGTGVGMIDVSPLERIGTGMILVGSVFDMAALSTHNPYLACGLSFVEEMFHGASMPLIAHGNESADKEIDKQVGASVLAGLPFAIWSALTGYGIMYLLGHIHGHHHKSSNASGSSSNASSSSGSHAPGIRKINTWQAAGLGGIASLGSQALINFVYYPIMHAITGEYYANTIVNGGESDTAEVARRIATDMATASIGGALFWGMYSDGIYRHAHAEKSGSKHWFANEWKHHGAVLGSMELIYHVGIPYVQGLF